eukprot:SAG31_NODE_1403_length_8489_cov_15.730751_7_plen_73_part_00
MLGFGGMESDDIVHRDHRLICGRPRAYHSTGRSYSAYSRCSISIKYRYISVLIVLFSILYDNRTPSSDNTLT